MEKISNLIGRLNNKTNNNIFYRFFLERLKGGASYKCA